MVEYPIISDTILGYTMRMSSRVAQVRVPEIVELDLRGPARFRSSLNYSLVTAHLSSDSPVSEADIRPVSLHKEPTTLSISRSCRSTWPLRISTALLMSFTLRREPPVLGVVKKGPLFIIESAPNDQRRANRPGWGILRGVPAPGFAR
jgi:hypothetical protein